MVCGWVAGEAAGLGSTAGVAAWLAGADEAGAPGSVCAIAASVPASSSAERERRREFMAVSGKISLIVPEGAANLGQIPAFGWTPRRNWGEPGLFPGTFMRYTA